MGPWPLSEASACTDVGQRRKHDEDWAGADASLGLLVVADGVGGHSSGVVASRLTVKTLFDRWRADEHRPWSLDRSWQDHPLVAAISLANLRVSRLRPEHGVSTGVWSTSTVVALARVASGVLIAHVGDCRCYRLRAGQLEQLTDDHTLHSAYRRRVPPPTERELAALPRDVITRSLGLGTTCAVDTRHEPGQPGDVFLLCSDGLTAAVSDERIAQILAEMTTVNEGCRRLIDEANAAGGPDNIAVALARW